MSTRQTTDDMFWIAYKMNLNIDNLSEFPIYEEVDSHDCTHLVESSSEHLRRG